MTIELNNVTVNQLSGDPQQLWTMPNYGPSDAVGEPGRSEPTTRRPARAADATTGPIPSATEAPQTTRAPGGWFESVIR